MTAQPFRSGMRRPCGVRLAWGVSVWYSGAQTMRNVSQGYSYYYAADTRRHGVRLP